MLKKTFLFAMLPFAAAAHADILYNNTNVYDQTTFYSRYHHVADDFQFGSANSSYNPAVTISQLELGYQVTSTAAATFDMVVNFYSDMDITSPSGTTSILSGLAKSYRFHFASEPTGPSTTGLIDLANFGGVTNLPAVGDFSRNNHGVEVYFYQSGTTTIDNDVTVLFKGNRDPIAGYSYDVYGRDANSDGTITASELSNFGGDPTRANFYLQLTGSVQAVPEPTTVAGLAMGALVVLRRRKRA